MSNSPQAAPTLPDLDADQLMAAAEQLTGLGAWGDDPVWQEGFRILVGDLRTTAALHEPGRQAAIQDLLRLLTNRLRFERDLAAHPEIEAEEIVPPIVILGLPRTGTSKLQRTIAADPGVQRLEVWRLVNPAPYDSADIGRPDDPRIAQGEEFEAGMRQVPEFMARHPMEAHEPDEDLWLMDVAFAGHVSSLRLYTPNFRAWLDQLGFEYPNRQVRRLLQYLQWQDGGGRGRPWVLKSPLHIGGLGALHEIYPDATFVHCHRDPRTAVASFTSLLQVARSMFSSKVDTSEMATDYLDFWARLSELNLDARKRPGLRIVDVGFERIRDDIEDVIEEIYAAGGRAVSDEARAAFRRYDESRSATHFGVHQYDPDEYGLTRARVDAAFAAYHAAFPQFSTSQGAAVITMDAALQDDPRLERGGLWDDLSEAIREMQDLILEDPRVDTPLLRAEGMRFLTRVITGGFPQTMEGWDFEHPWLVKFIGPYLQYGIPGADTRYHFAAVHGDHVYRIKGTRGTARLFDVETRTGHTANLFEWKLIDRKNDFQVENDGTIEIVLSATEQPGNWIRTAEGPGSIIMREYFYDWDTEVSADLVIEKDHAQFPPAPLTPQKVAEGLELSIAWVRSLGKATQFAINEYFEAESGTLKFVEIDFAWRDLLYGKGIYHCALDEAVILEVTPPVAAYWQYQLTSHFWEALDYNLRQTSLNGHQAVLDADGCFRAVICHADPGVPNWLDAGGHSTGLITARYYKGETTPVPTFKTVPLASVRDHLPAETASVSPEERYKTLQRRARSQWRRRM